MCITEDDFAACEEYQSKARSYDACLSRLSTCQDERGDALQKRDQNWGRFQEADRLRRKERERADSVARNNAILEAEVDRRWRPGVAIGTAIGVGVVAFAGGFIVGKVFKK